MELSRSNLEEGCVMESVSPKRDGSPIDELRQQCARATIPGVRTKIAVELYETDLRALTECILGGINELCCNSQVVSVLSNTAFQNVLNL